MIEQIIKKTINDSIGTIEARHYLSYDPYDALSSPALYWILAGNTLAERLAIQVIRKSCLNLRPILGIKKIIHANGISHLVSARVILRALNGEDDDTDTIREEVNLLLSLAHHRSTGIAWGLLYPYTTKYTKSFIGTSNLFTTINCANTLLDAALVLEKKKMIALAKQAASFCITDIGYVHEESSLWFRYYPEQNIPVYNVNALIAGFMARLYVQTHNVCYKEFATLAGEFVCRNQNGDGSWFYARGKSGHWIDGFHTGYILEGLLQLMEILPTPMLEQSITIGMDFYRRHLFTDDFIPKYYVNNLYPIDSQNCAQAIQILVKLSDLIPECLLDAQKVFIQARKLLYIEKHDGGYYFCSKNKLFKNKLYSLRWAQAPMVLAMAHLLRKMKNTQYPTK